MKKISEINGYEMISGFYITTCGKIIREDGRVRKNVSNRKGYLQVLFSQRHGKEKRTYKMVDVHRLVGLAFLPNPLGYKVLHHKDEDKSNPSICNMEWTSQSQNKKYEMIHKGKSAKSSLTLKDIKEIRKIGRLRVEGNSKLLSQELNLNLGSISRIFKNPNMNNPIHVEVCKRYVPRDYGNVKEIAKKYKVNSSTISRILRSISYDL